MAELAAAGVGDANRIGDAVTALRVAITETPRRAGVGKSLTTAVTETIRQSVAAVRACDHAADALVGLLAEKCTVPARGRRRAPVRPSEPVAPAAEPSRPARRARTPIPPTTRGTTAPEPSPAVAAAAPQLPAPQLPACLQLIRINLEGATLDVDGGELTFIAGLQVRTDLRLVNLVPSPGEVFLAEVSGKYRASATLWL